MTQMGFPIDKETQETFEWIEFNTEQFIKERIEVDTHFFFHSDLLRPIIQQNKILAQLKVIITEAVISKKGTTNCSNEIEKFLKQLNVYKREMYWDIKDLAFNLHQVHDAFYTRFLGAGLGYRYFVYDGSILEDSRDFCVALNNKVWSVEEAKDWVNWTPSKGVYPKEYQIKQEDKNTVPTYLSYPGYIPMIDRGGFNCRHFISWIPDDIAFKLRPDLKGYQGK